MPVNVRGTVSELSMPDLSALCRAKAVDDRVREYRRLVKTVGAAEAAHEAAHHAVPAAEQADAEAMEAALVDGKEPPGVTAPAARLELEQARVLADAARRAMLTSERRLLDAVRENMAVYLEAAASRQAAAAQGVRDAVHALSDAINAAGDACAVVAWLHDPGARPMAKLNGAARFVWGVPHRDADTPHLTVTVLAGLVALADDLDAKPAGRAEVAA